VIFGLLVDISIAHEKTRVSSLAEYQDWPHVKSTFIFDQNRPLFNPFGGLHHIYMNQKSQEAYKKGLGEGLRKFIGVMQKDLKKFKETGG